MNKSLISPFVDPACHLLPAIRRSGWMFLIVCAVISVRGAEIQTLRGHVLPAFQSLPTAGRLAGTNRLNLAISLPLRNPAGLSNLLQQIYNPASTNYHHYLTTAQFTEQFGPTEQDYQAVIAFAQAHHLQVTTLHPNRLLVDVSGPVTEVENTLHVTMHNYQHPTEKRIFHAPDREPTLDLAVPVLHISGLDNYALPRPHLQVTPLINGQNASPNAGSGPNGTFMGTDFRKAYVPDTTLDGSGQIVGLLQFDGYSTNDITDYEALAGLPNITLENILLDGFDGNPTGFGEIEVSLDIEMAISMATNLTKVMVYEAGPTGNWHDILNRIANDNLAKQVSCSWFIPGGGPNDPADQIFLQMQTQGQSFFNASGDSNAYTGAISFPCDTYYITQVGGTTLTTTNGGGWASEAVWHRSGQPNNHVGSGGGISTIYPIPSWQTNINMTNNLGSKTKRNVPDVAMTAENIYVRVDGTGHNVGGTSAAAPLWAGFAALVNQQAANAGKPTIGFVNPALTTIGSSAGYTNIFHDITTGNNTWSNSPTKFFAVPGYDLCTGWGTPAGQKLINALASPEALQITPATGFSAIAGPGGPFSVTSQVYTLTNIGTNTLTWTLSNTSLWLSVSSTNGTLIPGGPDTNVTVSLNTAASNLLAGTYTSTIRFTNQNDHVGQSRQFVLSVINPPVITLQPTNQTVLGGATVIFSAQATGGLPLVFQWRLNGTNLVDGGNIFGATTTNLTLNNVAVSNAGAYTIIVTNYAGMVTSSNAALTVTSSPPIIVLQPTNQTVPAGGSVLFAAGAVGSQPLFYQWSFKGTNIAAATNATFVIAGVQLTNAGNYSVLVTNLYGSTNSAVAILNVSGSVICETAGIVAWWKGESNFLDSVGANNGTPENGIGFTPGEAGTGFNLAPGQFMVANSATPSSLDVGQGGGMTFEEWINPTTVTAEELLFEYERFLGSGSGSDSGIGFAIHADSGGILYANLVDTNSISHEITSPPGLLAPGVWQHVALTYDKESGTGAIYINGVAVTVADLGNFSPATSFTNFMIGARTLFASVDSPVAQYLGKMDEISLYNRALSAAEIQTIYQLGTAGRCYTPTPPFIVTQPTNQTVEVAGTTAFVVGASGTPPLAYQWIFNGTNIANATNATLTLPLVQFTNAGNYSVLVTNNYGTTNSTNAVLTVYALPPFITTQPTNQSVPVGGTAVFSVIVTGTPPLTYQWKLNGTNIASATNRTIIVFPVQLTNAGNYSVLITNLYGSTNSAIAVLTVSNNVICTTAGIVAWWKGESNYLDTVGANDGTPENGIGFATGEVGTAFNLSSGQFLIANSATPSSLDVGQGPGLTFEEWINPTTVTAEEMLFEYERVLGSGNGSDTGIAMAIHADSGGVLYAQLATATVSHDFQTPPGLLVPGVWQHVALTYEKVSGLAAIYINGIAVTNINLGSFSPNSSFTNLLIGGRTYLGSVASPQSRYIGKMDEITLYNRALSASEIQMIYQLGSQGKCYTPIPPFIVTQPTNQSAALASGVSIAAVAGGTPPLNYQWSFNGTNIINATNATLNLVNVQFTNAGNYSVLVTNLYGSTNSTDALLTVFGVPPTITAQPTNQTIFLGGSATFRVTADGSPPLFYQWSFNGTNIVGATNTSLTLTNALFANAGNYSVLITNLFGSTNSAIAILTVNPPPPCDPPPTGLLGWWQAESNALESIAGNNGRLMNTAGYTNGNVGTAFNLTGAASFVLANPSAGGNLDAGKGTGLTIEGWIRPTSISSSMTISTFEKVLGASTSANNGVQMVINTVPGLGARSGCVAANIIDTNGTSHVVSTANNVLVAGVWQHVALTYDKASGLAALFTNGVRATQANLGVFVPQTSFTNLLFGGQTTFASTSNPTVRFSGQLDELSLYNRGLSSNEIAVIYVSSFVGKCPLPPFVTTQPTNQTLNVGSNATFAAFVGGTPILAYQWTFKSINIPNATNATLTVTNVQVTSAGAYALTISNAFGMTMSSNAILTVIDALDHFGWDFISTTRYVNTPFNVTVRALDPINLAYSNFVSTVSLTTANGVPVSPPVSANFTQGVWSGSLTISQVTPNLVLQASDGAGHVGRANVINIAAPPAVSMAQSGNSLLLYWPTDASGFMLESTPGLAPPQWTPVNPPPFTIGNQYLQLIQINSTNQQFYRLHFTLP